MSQNKNENKTKEEQNKLIELQAKKEAQQKLEKEDMQILMSLALKHRVLNLSAQEMQEKFKDSTKVFESEEAPEIARYYSHKFKNEKWYQPPKVDKGRIQLHFPDEKSLLDFAKELSGQQIKFRIIDINTNSVIAYSHGDGKVYHPDGKEMAEGESFGKGIPVDKFSIPSPAPTPRPTP